MNAKKNIGAFLICAFLFLLYWRAGLWLVRSWFAHPYYGHGFLVPLISGFIAWKRTPELQHRRAANIDTIVIGWKGFIRVLQVRITLVGAIALALGLGLYVLGFTTGRSALTAFSLLPVLAGLTIYFYGIKSLGVMAFPISFLVFMIPFPFVSDLAYHLQHISAVGSAWLGELIGLSITRTGAEISLPDSAFVVGLPCSGMNTLIALLALVAIFVYLLDGNGYKKVVLFLLAFPVAIAANVIRITALLVVADIFGADAATGIVHDLSSPFLYLLAFVTMAILARLMRCKLTASAIMRK